MSRSYKKNDPYKGTEVKFNCPRHGYCEWCDRNRQHQKNKTDEASKADLKTYDWDLSDVE